MAMPAWIPDDWVKLSEDEQKSVSDFMEFLLSRAKTDNTNEMLVKPLQYGVFKGIIKVSENFDDPLPEFADYM